MGQLRLSFRLYWDSIGQSVGDAIGFFSGVTPIFALRVYTQYFTQGFSHSKTIFFTKGPIWGVDMLYF